MRGFLYRLLGLTAVIALLPWSGRGATAGTDNEALPPRIWYSYQSGNWNDPTVWTLDPAVIPILVNPSNEVPAVTDQVVISNGRTVIATTNGIRVAGALVYGTLDLATSGNHDFTSIGGEGRIKMAGFNPGTGLVDNFPAGNATGFADAITGGTVEVYGTGLKLTTIRAFNNVVVNMTNATNAAILKANWTINGSLLIDNGIFQIDDATAGTALTVTLSGNFNVEPTGRVTVGTANRRHQFDFYGDFINNGGVVSFTNLAAANYTADATNGIVDANFLNDTRNQQVICNGATKFYRIEIDKGDDDTYKLSLSASSTANFLLYGRANYTGLPLTEQSTVNNNAVGLIFGTLEVGNNIVIPALSYNADNYVIYKGARLLINGTNAAVTKPAGATTTLSIAVYNTVTVSNGTLTATAGTGIELQGSGTLQVDGTGEVMCKQLRSVASATASGGFIQNGGTVTIDGSMAGTVPDRNFAILSLTNTANVFRMDAGTLTVRGTTANSPGLIFINSDPSSVSVTGGTINAEINTNAANNYRITSKAPFWNLNLRRTLASSTRVFLLDATTSGATLLAAQPLTVLGNLTIEGATTLNANSINVEVQSDFTLAASATYTTGTNTTLLSGSANGTLDLGANRAFYKLTVAKTIATAGVTLANAAGFDVSDELRVETGYLNYNTTVINARRDVYNAGTIGSATGTGKLVLNRTPAVGQTLSANGSLFYNLELNNTAGVTLALGNARVAKTLTMSGGVFNIGIYKLTLEGTDATIATTGAGFSTTKMIITSGEYSDGGLEFFFDGTTQSTYPLGTNANANTRYTPAVAYVRAAATAGRAGYITINPVDDVLSTANSVNDQLTYYWRVRHRDFVTLPNVNYQFTYVNFDISGTETNYVAGKVLDIAPFTRSYINNTNTVVEASKTIVFNGVAAGNATFPSTGFTLEQANYTAGRTSRFTGNVRVFYTITREDSNEPWWNDRYTWTRSDLNGFNPANPHSSTNPVVPNGGSGGNEYPQAGDIAVIGWTPWNDPINAQRGFPHNVWVDDITLSCAQIIFNQMKDELGNPTARKTIWHTVFIFRPTLTLSTSRALGAISSVKGEGIVRVRGTYNNQNSYDPNFAAIDFGEFAAEDSAYFQYEQFQDVTISRVPDRLPNLMLTSDGYGGNDQSITLSKTISTRGNLEILGNANLLLSNGAVGDVTVGGNLMMLRSPQNDAGGAELRFANSGTARAVTVMKDVFIGTSTAPISNARIGVGNANGTPTIHQLNLYGNYFQNTSTGDYGLRLGANQTNDYIQLNVLGDRNTTFTSAAGSPLQIVRMRVDKGLSIATTVFFNCDFDLTGTTNASPKALELLDGLMVLNNGAIDINLTTGNAAFPIPGTAGLEVRNGMARANGSSGIFLDGLLLVSGGTVAMGGANNYIEYSSSTKATLNVTAGSLTVGAQIRRTVSSTDGVLKYRQTGGSVVVGSSNAPVTTRGVFEIVNAQSEFTFTGAGTLLNIVRGVNSTTVPSILIDPSVYSQYDPATASAALPRITIGDPTTNAGADARNIGIKASIPLPNLSIIGIAANPATVKLYVLPLTIRGTLATTANASFECGGLNLTLQGDFTNAGAYRSGGNTTIFSTVASRTVSGAGTFDIYRLEKNGTQTLTQNVTTLTVTDQFNVAQGTWATNATSLVVQGNVIMDGNMTSTSGVGLVFRGTAAQTLSRTTPGGSSISIVTINNAEGVVVPDGHNFNFTIDRQLRLERGVFDIGGNLIILPEAAGVVAVNAFSDTNMVRTNASISEGGIRKNFPARYTTNFIFPVGQSEYTPVTFNFGATGNTTGTTAGSIRVTLASEVHPTIVEDTETGCQFADRKNALNYYFTIDGATLASSFRATATLKFPASAVLLDNTCGLTTADYIAARVLYDNNPTEAINKFSTAEFDETNNVMNFAFTGVTDLGISGDYFAGLDAAIPNRVPIFHTRRNGQVNEGTATGVYDLVVPGGGSPTGAVVIIEPGHTLNFNIDGVTLYKTEIKAGAVLNVSQTETHRLGIVSGQGTLRITSNTNSAVVPAGFYTDFFGCTGGILEYAGTGSYDVLGGMPNMRNLAFTGSGQRYLANNDIFVCDSMYVNGPEFYNHNGRGITIENNLAIDAGKFSKGNGTRLLTVHGNVEMRGGEFANVSIGDRIIDGDVNVRLGCIFYVGAGGTITVGGDFNSVYPQATFNGGTGSVMLALEGTRTQNLNGLFTGPASFLNVRVKNPAGVNVNGNTDIGGELQLTDGLVTPGLLVQLRMLASAYVTPTTGRSNSFIVGPLYKTMPVGSSFTFPVGKVANGQRWRYASVNNVSNGPYDWKVEYHIANPVRLPFILSSLTDDPLIQRVSIAEFWTISDGLLALPGTTATIGLSWGVESDVSPLAVEQEKLAVLVWLSNIWGNKGGIFPTAHTQASGYVLSSKLTSFSEKIATLGSTDPVNPLPVEVINFSGQVINNENYLSWQTATEVNNRYFVLERSADGNTFTPLAQLDGGGNLPAGASYSYVDRAPVVGVNYYRLKQIDFDGKATYVEKLVMLRYAPEAEVGKLDFYIAPNPTQYNRINFLLSHAGTEAVSARLISMTGIVAYETVVTEVGEDWVRLEAPATLSQGLYILEIRQGGRKVAKRIVIE